MLPFLHIALVATIAASAAKSAGVIKTPLTPPPPPTWRDKCGDVFFWLLVFSPAILIAAVIGLSLYIIVKISFLKQGIAFP